jgi:hypothetical protein
MQAIAACERTYSIGKPGDLADTIVAVLSLASIEHGLKKISLPDFYMLFPRLVQDFPERFPPMRFEQTGRYVYSKALGDALEHALRLGIEVMNPRFQYIGVRDTTDAKRNLELIEGNTGGDFIQNLRPVAAKLAEAARKNGIAPE